MFCNHLVETQVGHLASNDQWRSPVRSGHRVLATCGGAASSKGAGRPRLLQGDRFGLKIGLADANRVTIACGQSSGAPAVGLRLRP